MNPENSADTKTEPQHIVVEQKRQQSPFAKGFEIYMEQWGKRPLVVTLFTVVVGVGGFFGGKLYLEKKAIDSDSAKSVVNINMSPLMLPLQNLLRLESL